MAYNTDSQQFLHKLEHYELHQNVKVLIQTLVDRIISVKFKDVILSSSL